MDTPKIIANRYELLESLGQGGFGSVFKVKDLENDEIVALKYLANRADGVLDARRFRREFQHLARLKHPHVVAVKDTGQDEAGCYFTMEYLEGVTLGEALKAPDTGLYQVLQSGGDIFREILIQICEALACIHSNGLVHRDLKPANIFLQSDQSGPHAKILDLGLVKFRSEEPSPLTEEGIMLGTVHYMSPEQIRGVHVDHRSDLYTLGVVLYEVLTGQKPFLGQNSASVVLKHLNEIPVPPRVYNLDVPHDLQLVVLKLLEKEPERRYRFANDVIADLKPSKSTSGRGKSKNEPTQLLQHPRFLGRSEEMATARRMLADVQAGKGRALCISGPAGIGKTRFLNELKADAGLRGLQVLHATCFEDRTAPFQPVVEAIRSASHKLGGLSAWIRAEDRNELARLFPELGDVQETIDRSLFFSLNQEDLFVALLQLLKDLAHRVPLIMCFDDMQWADQGTREFVSFLTERLDLLPILLCLAQRKLDGTEPQWNAQVEFLALEPLGTEGTNDLLVSMFGTEDIPQKFCDEIFELSGGNPFSALEIAKALFANKAIFWNENQWIYQGESENLPAEVEKAVVSRISFFSEQEREIIYYAAVINRPFNFELLAKVLGEGESTLFEQLERLVQFHLLFKDSRECYQVYHGMISDIIYRRLAPNKLEELHSEIAEILASSHQIDGRASEIAFHYLQANLENRAWPFLVQAGDKACATYTLLDAENHYKNALDIVSKKYDKTSETYLNVLCRYVEILRWMRNWDGIKENISDLLKCSNLPSYYYARLVRIVSVPLLDDGQTEEVEILLNKALKLVSDPQYDVIRIHLYIGLSQVYWATGRYSEANSNTEKIIGLCQKSAQSFYKTFGYFVLGHNHLTNSRFRVAEEAFQKALSEFENVHRDRRYIQMCRAALREIYTYRGRFQQAEQLSQMIIDNAKNTGMKPLETYEKIDLGYIFFEQDKLDQAEACYLEVVDTFKKIKNNHKLSQAYIRLSELYLKVDDFEKALNYALNAEKILTPDLHRQSQAYRALGNIYAALDDIEQAEVYFEKSKNVLKKVQGFHYAVALFESSSFNLCIGKKRIAELEIEQAMEMFKKMGADHFFNKAQKIFDRIESQKLSDTKKTEFSSQVESALNTAQLLNEAIDRLLQITQADRGLILIVEEGKPRLQTACSRHIDETGISDISNTVVQATVESGSLIVTSDASQDPRFEKSVSIADSNVGSILCMPLKSRQGNVIGVVYADRSGDAIFSAQAVSFFKSFAAFVAVGLEHAMRSDQLQNDLEKFAGMRTHLGDLVGVSPAMQHLYDTISQISETDVPILLQGETGVGKGLVARTIHNKSLRNNSAFLSVNCGALPRELLESELFGHKKGSFTGATEDREGLFEASQGGTLFLDEIGEAPADVQVLLLHVLEDKVVRRVGENKTRTVDVRVIAASNRDLGADVESGKFRRDLFYRLNVMTLKIPPLRERTEDILLLAKHFLEYWNRKMNKNVVGFDPMVHQALLRYEWPGNIRELDNEMYRAVALANDGEQIKIEYLSDVFQSNKEDNARHKIPTQTLKAEVASYEKELIIAALEANKWNVKGTAEKLEISRVALGQKIKKYGIQRPE